ncbi:bifunctional nuclease family protein [Nitrospiraceae bacterium AH_259_D15_M11_P09]|nr:bifunctional nuclease family protein [Nitrospiraceae bacterium AH_259_D15_M11_P09]
MKRLGMLFALSALVGMSLSVSGATSSAQVPQVEINDVQVRLSDHGPVVLLKAENKVIAIFVDPTVAGSIQGALTGQKTKRPLSHDLMHSILDEFGGKVTQTVITLNDGIYYGALTVVLKDESKVFDSRSSDAIALAIHSKAPIIVGRDLLDSAGKTFPDSSGSVTL